MMLGRSAGVRPDANHSWQYQATQVRQMYRNSVDCEGGYFSRYCVLPQPQEPLVQPMARLSRLWLKAFKSAESGRWHIDQSALVWRPRPVPLPRTGETVESFC